MKRLAALLIVLCMLLSAAGATAGNEQVQGEVVIYSSMYQFVLDMLDEDDDVQGVWHNLENDEDLP